jgi:hypothetical protein
MAWTPPTQAEVGSYFEWFNHGTLNFIAPAKREAAIRLARRGRLVSLDLTPYPNLDYPIRCPGYRDRCDTPRCPVSCLLR